MTFSATYSPEDDKLRLSASSRLDKDLYARVKDAGFGWAPKQEVFYAVWSPNREDLMIELAGEIGDEDTTLVERAEVRADRFEDYSDKRTEDAHRAKDAVERIADGTPFGQPIMVGHHSERHARKDAEKIRSGMDRAVKMWETANYWKSRAAGAVRAAKYKELPAVRARRIKGLEADKRGHERDVATAEKFSALWSEIGGDTEVRVLTMERATAIANHDRAASGKSFPLAQYPREAPASQYEGAMGLWSALTGGVITPVQAREIALRSHAWTLERAARWLQHLNNRLEYERAMLADGGGLVADKFEFAVGGQICRRGEWFVVTGINRKDGEVRSLSVSGHWATTVQVEDVKDYRAPEAGDTEKVKAATKLAPICNYPGEGFLHQTKAEYDLTVPKWSDFTKIWPVKATETSGRHRLRHNRKPGGSSWETVPVFLTDQKRVDTPAAAAKPAALPARVMDENYSRPAYVAPEPTDFDAMRDSLRAGVQVVSAPQLFPTPKALARRMVEIAGIMGGERVLEPSAGTGVIVREIHNGFTGADNGRVVAVEMSGSLVAGLEQTRNLTVGANESNYEIVHGDFLEQNGNLGKFDAVLMNPPFVNGSDIKHIQHAVKFLKPGGVLVAICANGPRQREALQGIAEHWEDLPAGTFAEAGTGVNTALLVLRGE